MLGVAQYHKILLPKGWPRRVRSGVIQVLSLARGARQITPSRGRLWPAWHRLISLAHYTGTLQWTTTLAHGITTLTPVSTIKLAYDLQWMQIRRRIYSSSIS